MREVAEELFGRRRVAADWHPDGDLRAKTRRRIRKAVAMTEYGYRDLAAGRPVRLNRIRSATDPARPYPA